MRLDEYWHWIDRTPCGTDREPMALGTVLLCRRTLLCSVIAQGIVIAAPNRLLAASPITLPASSADRRFAVFYEGGRIGTHVVRSTPVAEGTRVDTEVDMTVKRLFFTVFSYRHSSQETWQGGRLMALKSATTEDGESSQVEGAAIPNGFRGVGKAGPFITSAAALTSDCLWTSLILQQRTMIDTQFGGVVGLSVHRIADGQIVVAGRPVAVARFRLVTPGRTGTILYDAAGSWVGGKLQRRGSIIEYRFES